MEQVNKATQPYDLGLRDYHPHAGVPDEMMQPEGKGMRALWEPLIAHLAALGPEGQLRATARADQYLRDSGVIYRQYGAGQSVEREWPLSHVPVLISEAEWHPLAEGLIERAELLEALMADLYGPNSMVGLGHLPAGLIAASPEWLRPMVGVSPASGHFLHFLAFEIGRGPNGDWWVLADRAQAPSGAGYALENRVASSRAFSELYEEANVHRLAGFFRAFREALLGLRHDREGQVAILTPGPLNETYYEHAWIARYLGFTLAQGEDLVVEQGRMMLRTVSGLRPLDVLWRRLDAGFADPLELEPSSRLGTPGLVSALRRGGLTMVNALGSGLLENRAMMAFLPRLAPHLIGRKLKLPNIATWWLGDAAAQAEVRAKAEGVALSSAFATGLPYESGGDVTPASSMSPEALTALLAREGEGLVAQETITLSTTPALVGGKLVPRPVSLRVYLARTASGWQVMPGGFARIGDSQDPAGLQMQRGGNAADVWIVSPHEVEVVTMAPSVSPEADRLIDPGNLPSRAADNLFWLGRYVERTEGIVRLLRARNMRLVEGGRAAAPLMASIDPILESYGVDPTEGIPEGLLDTLAGAIGSAGQVRDRFSPDGWSALRDLDKSLKRMSTRVEIGDDAARALSAVLRKLAGFTGLVHENMYRFTGWRFLTLGRLQERAMWMTAVLASLADPKAPGGSLDLCVELGDSVLAHRRRFTVSTSRETVVSLLVLDPLNPRAIRHHLDQMMEQVRMLPGVETFGQLSPLGRAVLQVQAELTTSDPEAMTTQALLSLRGRLAKISDLMTEAYLR